MWWYNGKEWHVQDHLVIDGSDAEEFNIIEDKHFEARKADALGEEVEHRVSIYYDWELVSGPSWGSGEYRPKPKETILTINNVETIYTLPEDNKDNK